MQQLSYDGAYPDVISFDPNHPGTKFQNSLPQWKDGTESTVDCAGE